MALHETAGTALDLERSELQCADGSALHSDALSIDTGPMPTLDALPGAEAHALPVRPIERFIAAWPSVARRIVGQCRRFDLLVLGAGAARVELAFANRHRAAVEGWSHLYLTAADSGAWPLPGAPRWPAAAGLATDDDGFIQERRSLQSDSHPHVAAAGDVATYADARPKSSVCAVRAGPALALNLRAFCEGRPLRDWAPQRRAPYLISTGGRQALATWGHWAWRGRWVWRRKHRIDRRFMRRFGTPGQKGRTAMTARQHRLPPPHPA